MIITKHNYWFSSKCHPERSRRIFCRTLCFDSAQHDNSSLAEEIPFSYRLRQEVACNKKTSETFAFDERSLIADSINSLIN